MGDRDYPHRPRVSTDGTGRGFPGGSPSSASPRPRTPNGNLHPEYRHPFTPPQSPYRPRSSGSLNQIRELEDENRDLRFQVRNFRQLEQDYSELQYQWQRLSDDLSKVNGDYNALISQHQALSAEKAEVDRDNHRLQLKLDNTRHEQQGQDSNAHQLAKANKKIQEYESMMFSARNVARNKTFQLAELYTLSRKHGLASDQYKELMQHMGKETKLRNDLQHYELKQQAEEAKCAYEFEYAKALDANEKYAAAETHFRSVLGAETSSTRSIPNAVNFDYVALRLAKVIGIQGRLPAAKDIYERRMQPLFAEGFAQRSQIKRDNVLRHASEYYLMTVKEKDYQDALFYLNKILGQKSTLSASAKKDIETTIWTSIDVLETRNQEEYLPEFLSRLCGVVSHTSPSDFDLKCLSKQGTLLLYRGQPDSRNSENTANHDHAYASRHLQRVWDSRQRLDDDLFLSTGWTLALTSLCLSKYDTAINVLETLESDISTRSIADKQPTQHQISALLAYCDLQKGAFASAESTAQEVFDHHGLNDIFVTNLPRALDGAEFHQANILIRALSKQAKSAKFEHAKKVWKLIFDAKSKGWDGSAKATFASHLDAGVVLASEWTKHARSAGKKPKSGPEVGGEVERLRRAVKRWPDGWTRGEFERVK
jgi:hypothetical protein